MIHKNSEKYLPLNLYAATKKSFLDILKYYETTFKDVKFYNLFLHDIYRENDQRDKIIHTIIRNHKKNKKIKSRNYIIKYKKITNIVNLINKINLKIKKKIKFRVLNKEIEKEIKKKIKLLPYWKQKFTIEKDLIKYLNENS